MLKLGVCALQYLLKRRSRMNGKTLSLTDKHDFARDTSVSVLDSCVPYSF